MAVFLDPMDQLAAEAFKGLVVRKDLARQFQGQYPVPTYVGEFLLGRFCATTDEDEIEDGLRIVAKLMSERTVRAGEHEVHKHRARDQGSVKIIDHVTARLDAKTDSYMMRMPSLQLTDVRIEPEMVSENERLLTGGFYAEVDLEYDAVIAQQKNGRPFGVRAMRPIQLSQRNALADLAGGRKRFNTEQWKQLLLRSVGLEWDAIEPRARDIMLMRMVPFVERNYNVVELGPRGTGKSHLFQQISPYSHLVSGGKATVAQMFVNNANGQRGLVCLYDVVCFDEISGISFDQKDGINILKGYMESGEFSRGRESIRGEGSLVFVGNFDVDVQHQQRISHLFGPLPAGMQDDTAWMDRIHAYLPGWEIPKMERSLFTDHFGLVSDFLSECWAQLRQQSRLTEVAQRVQFGGALSGRDTRAVQKTVSGLLKLLYPGTDLPISDEDLEWATRLALECRRRVKEQQRRILQSEFRNVSFSYRLGEDGIEQFVATPEVQGGGGIGTDPLPPGHIWGISPGGGDESPGLYRIEVNETPGSGKRLLNLNAPAPLRESMETAYQNLLARSRQLVGDRDPRQHELVIQARAMDPARSGMLLGVPALLAMAGAILAKSLKGGLVVVGGLTVGGSLEDFYNIVEVAELAVEKEAQVLLAPVTLRKKLYDLSDDMAAKLTIVYYTDAQDALVKALME